MFSTRLVPESKLIWGKTRFSGRMIRVTEAIALLSLSSSERKADTRGQCFFDRGLFSTPCVLPLGTRGHGGNSEVVRHGRKNPRSQSRWPLPALDTRGGRPGNRLTREAIVASISDRGTAVRDRRYSFGAEIPRADYRRPWIEIPLPHGAAEGVTTLSIGNRQSAVNHHIYGA